MCMGAVIPNTVFLDSPVPFHRVLWGSTLWILQFNCFVDFHPMTAPHFIPPSPCRHIGCFQFLSLQTTLIWTFWCMSTSGCTDMWTSLQYVRQNTHQQWTRAPVPLCHLIWADGLRFLPNDLSLLKKFLNKKKKWGICTEVSSTYPRERFLCLPASGLVEKHPLSLLGLVRLLAQ